VEAQPARLEQRRSVRLAVDRRLHRPDQSGHHGEGVPPELLVAQAREGRGRLLVEERIDTATESGTTVEPQNILRAVKAAASAAALTGVAVHTLRHSAATTWLENGVHLKAVSELLGHASIAITADIYGHLSEETARGAMATLSDAIRL